MRVVVLWPLFLATFGPITHVSAQTATSQSFIQIENAKPGTTDWKLTSPGYASGTIEGYASLTSVNRGGSIKLFVNTADPTYTLEIFRTGYYQGSGGRRMTTPVTLAGTRQSMPTPDPATGLIECNWINPYVLNISGGSDPTDWMSGFYYVKLTALPSGKQQYITFVVRDDMRASDLIMAGAVTTSQAYNVWGGKSLYGTSANLSDTANAARKVSFDRPYYGDETFGAGNYSDKSDFHFWEWGMVQFLEANGYDVSYATNIDVDANPDLLLRHKAFLSVGHDEYWSGAMRDNVEHARDLGINLGFFSANTSYWQVRFEANPTTGDSSRVMVGYKDYCAQDPITPTYYRTCLFRSDRVNRREDAMMGVLYVTQGRMPFVVEDASHWVFTGTGLKNGDVLVNPDGSYFVGYEIDAMGIKSPANTQRLAHSPATASNANFADMVMYRAPSGATVFSAGSIQWTYDVPQLVQITKNVLARFTTNAFTDTIPIRPQLPVPFQAVDIGDVGRPGFVSRADTDQLTLNGGGQDSFDGSDALHYVYQQFTGDLTITARLTGVQDYWDNRAGLMIRESLDPAAKYVAAISRPSDSRMNGTSGVNEGAEFKVKDAIGGNPVKVARRDFRMPNWLKLSKTGSTFDSYTSADGVDWTFLGSAAVPMNSNIFVGAMTASARHGVWMTASFDNLAVTAGGYIPADPIPDTIPPTVALTQPANNSTVAGIISVAADASDNGEVAGVQFQLDGTNLGAEVTTSPYSTSWDTTATLDGAHTLSATARDAAGNTATSTMSVMVANAIGPACPSLMLSRTFFYSGAPSSIWNVAVTAPTATCSWTATIDQSWLQLNASSGPASVQGTGSGWITLSTDDNLSASTRYGQFAIGGVIYTVTDEGAVAGLADTTPPVASITAPTDASTVAGTIDVTARATDDVGIAGVRFKLDGVNLGAEVTAAPFSTSWDTSSSVNGSHQRKRFSMPRSGLYGCRLAAGNQSPCSG
jgi:regulation of enolase protein 1 (concanavalin A-like superfamily)